MILQWAVATFEDDVETFLKGISGGRRGYLTNGSKTTSAVSPRTCAGAKPSFTSKQHDS
jgi:hypothetical protein